MANRGNIVDVVVHLHPESSCEDRNRMEEELRALQGVVSVRFNAERQPHTLVVAYDHADINADEILAATRKCDEDAVMAGL